MGMSPIYKEMLWSENAEEENIKENKEYKKKKVAGEEKGVKVLRRISTSVTVIYSEREPGRENAGAAAIE